MKFPYSFLLLVSLSTLQMTCYNSSDYDHLDSHSGIHETMVYPPNDFFQQDSNVDFNDELDVHIERPQIPPNIVVYEQVKDKGDFFVICRFTGRINWISLELSVESEHLYTKKLIGCSRGGECLFMVIVIPPASFTCVVQIDFNGNILYYRISEIYSYSQFGNQDSDDHEKGGVSSFYISFVSIIAVCLMIMITAVIAITIMSNSKEPIKTNSDYENA